MFYTLQTWMCSRVKGYDNINDCWTGGPLLFKPVVGLDTNTHSLSLSRLIVLMWSMNPFSELIKHYRRWKHVLVKDVCDFNEMYKDSRNACFNIILSCLIPLYFIPLSDDLWTLWGKTLERSSLYIHTHKKKTSVKTCIPQKYYF